MKRTKFILIALSFQLLTLNALSQELKLSMDEAVRLALENNRQIKIAENKVSLNEAKYDEANANLFPQLKFSARYSRLNRLDPFIIDFPFLPAGGITIYEPLENHYSTKLSLDYPIFSGLRLSNNAKMQSSLYKASKEELNASKNEIEFAVKSLYLKYMFAFRSREYVVINIQQLESSLKTAKDFYTNGLATENDVLKIEVALTNAKVKLLEVEDQIENINLNMCNLLSLKLDSKIIPTEKIDTSVFVYPQDQNLSLINRPEIKAAEKYLIAGEFGITMAKGSWFPNLILNANYEYARPNTRIFPLKDEWKYSWDVNLVFQFTIWDWLIPKYKTEQAAAQYEQSKFLLEDIKARANAELINNSNQLKTAIEKIKLTKKELTQAEENFRITKNKYEVGLLTTTELLDANRLRFEAELHNYESMINYLILKEEQKKISGAER